MNRTVGVQHSAAVVCVAGSVRIALPVASVIEVMRPLPIEAVAATGVRGVLGASVIRGEPTIVVDAATVLGQEAGAIGRFVTVRAGTRQVALAVKAVVGVQALGGMHPLPPLLAEADRSVVAQIAARDGALMAVLEAAHLVDFDAE